MQKKTKHRILGVLVIIGLAVILFPLFQGEKDATSHTALIKAPPFPDQPVQVSAVATPPASATQAAQTQPTDSTEEETIPIKQAQDSAFNQQPDEAITVNSNLANDVKAPNITPLDSTNKKSAKTSSESIAKHKVADATQEENNENNTESTSKNNPDDNAVADGDGTKSVTIASPQTKELAPAVSEKLATSVQETSVAGPVHTLNHPHATKAHNASYLNAPIESDGLMKLKNAVWVIQVGSFKNKTAALRLVNHLRVNGYRAFIQEIKTAFGGDTQVYVGPEYKPTSARALANQLENDLHLRGIVISYKPFAL